MEKVKKNTWGGARPRSGPKKGSAKKVKICVSVDSKNWDAAITHWTENPLHKRSWLVDGLISDYLNAVGSLLKTKAAI
jgi:hypothetical protein